MGMIPEGTTEDRLSLLPLRTLISLSDEAAGVGALYVSCCDAVILRLALFANFDTCWTALLLLSEAAFSLAFAPLDCCRYNSAPGCCVLLLK